MPAPAVTLSPGLPPRARWVLEQVVSAAGARVVPRDAPELAFDPGSDDAWDAAERGEPPAEPLDLAGAFFHLARLEERGAAADDHGRFPAAASCLGPGATPVDALVEPVREALLAAGVEPDASYPGGARFAVALTHDIDTPWRWTRPGILGAAARGKAALAGRRLGDAAREARGLAAMPLHRLRGTDPNWSFDRMAAIERPHGWRSTSFLLAAHRDPHDGAAPLAYQRLRPRLVAAVTELGDEVGLHGSYRSSEDPELLAVEKRDLETVTRERVRGHRFHYLRMRFHAAARALESLEFAYDTSLGYAERTGPRAGFSYPFRPWDLATERPLRLVELPLVLMDATLAEERYLALSPDEGLRVAEEVLDRLAEARGCAAILWHNDRFDAVYGRGWDRVYARVLEGIERRGGWAGPAGDVVDWWRSRRCGS